jgi:hypothetical protein
VERLKMQLWDMKIGSFKVTKCHARLSENKCIHAKVSRLPGQTR